MTTRSVHRFVIGSLNKLGMKEENVTKFQTGGPDGDLGSNEILCSKDRTVAIVDGSGVLFDPAGINRTELVNLAQKRETILHFDPSKLGPGGFKVLVSDTNIKLPTGEMVDSGVKFRNEFHLHPLATADVFVPCGGRPEAVNLSNVDRLFTNGKPKFKIIVEGANLFFTNDARMVLEDAGVTLFKDASTNKGGVTSSSKEVLAALALDDATFATHMSVTDPNNPPEFYMRYVKEIQETVEALADAEFECLWREKLRTGHHSHILTEMVSAKINTLNDFVQASETLWTNVPVRNAVLHKALPKSLVGLVGLESIIARVPENYLKAIHACFLASQYVYKHGLAANEFSFFEFMQPFSEDAGIGLDGADTKEPVLAE
jgi:glutamate dehydrogenase